MSFSKLIPAFKKASGDMDYSKINREDCEIKCKVDKKKFDTSVFKVEDCIESPIFPNNDNAHFKWEISLYPVGDDEEYLGYISIYIYLNWKKIEMPVSAAMRIEIRTETDTVVKAKDIDHLYTSCSGWGYNKFCKTNKVKELSSETLIVHVQICAYYEVNSCLTSNFTAERELLSDYSRLLESGDFSDMVLYVKKDETEFQVHSNILSLRSKVFRAMLLSDMNEKKTQRIDIEDVSSSTMKSVLDFLYCCKVDFEDKDMVLELLDVSDMYDIIDLKLQCAEYLSSIVNKDNVGVILTYAHRYNLSELKTTILKYICRNKDKLSDKMQYQIILKKNPEIILEILAEFAKYIDFGKVKA